MIFATYALTDLLDFIQAPGQGCPNYYLVENCFTIGPEGSLVKNDLFDGALLKKFKGILPVLKFSSDVIRNYSLPDWVVLHDELTSMYLRYKFEGYYFEINCVLPHSFYLFQCTLDPTECWMYKTGIVDVVNHDQYPEDFLRMVAKFFGRFVVRSYDHFEYDPETGGILEGFCHDFRKTIDLISSHNYFSYPGGPKFMLRLSTHAVLFKDGECIKIPRRCVIHDIMKNTNLYSGQGLSWDSSTDIHHKLKVFISDYRFIDSVCIEDMANDLPILHPLSVYSLCKNWHPNAVVPDDGAAMPLNVLVPRKGTKSESTSGDETANQEEKGSTTHSEQA